MNIAIDVSQMCYGTGVSRYLLGLTGAMLKAKSTHNFVLYAGTLKQLPFFQALKKTFPWDQADWKILPLPPRLAARVLNSLPLPIEKLIGNFDLFHSSDWVEPISHFPEITTVHDLVFRKFPGTVDPLILNIQTTRFAHLKANHTHILADSQSTKSDLMNIYGFIGDRISVVYPGIDPIFNPQSQTEIERVKIKYHLPDSYLLSVATKEPRKNLTRLISAFQTLRLDPAWAHVGLVLAGKSGWGQELLTTPGVVSPGFVDDVDLPGLYSGSQVFVYPSLYEGFGFPVGEALACGVPVVTSNVSSLPEVGGDAAVLVDPTSVEAIKNGIIQADKERHNRIPLGIEHIKQFTWEKTAKQVLEVYDKVANWH